MPQERHLTTPRQPQASASALPARGMRLSRLALLVSVGAFLVQLSPAMAEKKKVIVIQATSHEIKSPRDTASGVATGRRAPPRAKAPGAGRQGGHMTTIDGGAESNAAADQTLKKKPGEKPPRVVAPQFVVHPQIVVRESPDLARPARAEVPRMSAPAAGISTRDVKVNTAR
jgi:hypothetical protein